MEKRIPKTKEEGFAQLDAMLSDEEKKELMNCEDTFLYHFTLGMWIRNNWLYPLNEEEEQAFVKMFADDDDSPYGFFPFHPDCMSSVIIDSYQKYLKKLTK